MDILEFKIPGVISEGRWIADLPGFSGVRLKVRGTSAPQARILRNRLTRSVPWAERIDNGLLTPEAEERIQAEVLCGAILLDWDGLTDKGAPVPFSADLARTWLTDPRFYRFADAVILAAWRVDQGQQEEAEAAAKN